jgi:Animal haem peroxidase
MKNSFVILLLGSIVSALAGLAAGQVTSGSPGDKKLSPKQEEAAELKACVQHLAGGFLRVPDTRELRFQGKVTTQTARCRGGQQAVEFQFTPWVDWARYWGAGDSSSLPVGFLSVKGPQLRGIAGALTDLEYQRMELIKFNLFDNSGTYQTYLSGRGGVGGPALKTWPEMRLPKDSPDYDAVGGDGEQLCKGDLIRARTLNGICNDIRNPRMGSTGMPFMRNVEFETTFPDLEQTTLTKNRHGGRINLLTPDPQLISRKLFTRPQSSPAACNSGFGLPNNSVDANCDYEKAPFFNVLAAYWIQFMTHDWFSHMDDGHNAPGPMMDVGCKSKLVNNVPTPLTPDEIQKLGCRPNDAVDKTYVLNDSPPEQFTVSGHTYLSRAPKIYANNNTAWWDASQLYGYDETSVKRVKRDPQDSAKMQLESVPQFAGGYLPVLQPSDPAQPQWRGQESVAFPDNWSIGLSFYHNLFAREHNSFVDEFRRQAAQNPTADSGLRNPSDPSHVIRNQEVTPDELFNVARLVVAAEIAKIHTIEWTTQLLYDEPLYKGMNANWNGLLGAGDPEVSQALSDIVVHNFGKSEDVKKATQWYSAFASGPGIIGLGSNVDHYEITNSNDVNGGVNHFGAPFNFPEEFVTVYRLHPLVPDLIEYRDAGKDPNKIVEKVAVIQTFENKATDAMRSRGIANWGLSLGRQRLGLLTLHNHPQFLQNIRLPRLDSPTGQIDIAALDLIRDREHGIPRFNEFRRQYGLRQLTSYDDFVDQTLPADSAAGKQQMETIAQLREIYGTHVCDSAKVITDAQLNPDGTPINDCLGHPNGSVVDNIEDVDTVVGWLAEYTRPHGFAISETQFVVFILNASRRLYSDRFFTSSFRPEFYTKLGVDWVNHNGPGPEMMETGTPNGHRQPVAPLKRVLMRNIPELTPELQHVINAFDPWGRDRGQYYSLEWKPIPDATSDSAFKP